MPFKVRYSLSSFFDLCINFLSLSDELHMMHEFSSGALQQMADLWPGVAAVYLCLVCVTSALTFHRGALLMSLLKQWGKEDRRSLLMLQLNQTDRRCTLQEPVPPNTEIMMTPLPSQCGSLHLFQSLSVKQPDWSAVFLSACVSTWSCCAAVQRFILCSDSRLLFVCSQWHHISSTCNKRDICHRSHLQCYVNSCQRLIM